ncbi:MAG TPA: thiamine pyrophosphate-dependent dehydrogenase E1 component subunit alpha [Candidatus Dormibacteraeota bacterium]|nr:thiamine pyrophosphate-dependent dehydrogenase E1 component subunit alpha [Candidatus Dormibacteraeota bacterium]
MSGRDPRGDLARNLYVVQLRIRRFEETVARLFAQGRLPGFVHLSIGQEAVAAGACAALREDDVITSTHRGHGHCIAKGGDLGRMMAELFGYRDGYCAGLGGSMHIADLERGVLGANGIVGAGIPIAAGAAYAFQVRGLDRVALAFFGDGAANEGAFHEGLNLAALWRLPVVYVCEDNGYAELTATAVHTAGPGVAARAAAYGMPAAEVDGTDALAVHDVVARAVERCRSGEGPTLVVARAPRWHGHFEGDPQRYRSRAELEQVRREDPVALLSRRLLAERWADPTWLEAMAIEIEAEVTAAVAFAEGSAPLDPEAMLRVAGVEERP